MGRLAMLPRDLRAVVFQKCESRRGFPGRLSVETEKEDARCALLDVVLDEETGAARDREVREDHTGALE
jgi:hypothetical protein